MSAAHTSILPFISQPFGNFPINDDWAYAHSVIWLGEEGRFALSDWIAMNLLPQTLMGATVAEVFGFSLSALRGLTQVIALATSLLAYAFFPCVRRAIHGRASHFVMLLLNLDVHRWTKFAQKSLEMTGYLGLFLVGPLAAYFLSHEEKRANIARIVLAAFVVFVICLSFNWLPPYRINNLITVTGIGPYTLLDGMVDDSSTPHSKGFFWQAAGALASLGMVLLLYALMKIRTAFHRLSRTASAALVMFSAIILCYLLPFAITDYFDRYLLFVCPFLYAAIVLILNHVTETPIRAWGHALSCFMLMGLLSAAVVHDYFSWNRARWAMIHHAETELGANSFDLDGGFEYNGFHNFESRKKVGGDQGKSWWWVVDDMYRVSFGLMPGYSSIRHIVVDAYLPTTPERVHLLKRNE